jgi:hypothetical protein
MTGVEWLACNEPESMLQFLNDRASERKLRLLACACCRRLYHLSTDERVWDAVAIAERFADGLVTDAERSNARKSAQQAAQSRAVTRRPTLSKSERRTASMAYYATARGATEAAYGVLRLAIEPPIWRAGGHNACDWKAIKTSETATHAAILRDIFGSPFHSLILDPSWLSWNDGTIVKLARVIYDECAFERLPILADALEESGCTNPEILNHCRQPGEHVRGCWVVDLILGKS